MPRFYCPAPLVIGELLTLPAGAARHVQVLRLQPGDSITLFNGNPAFAGSAGEFSAAITQMGRSEVQVRIGAHQAVEREAIRAVHLALSMPANERMDWLVEKATELGVASIQPLMSERSVLRLSAERAAKKVAHWQSIAVSACEQCGGNRVPLVHEVTGFSAWVERGNQTADKAAGGSFLLTLRPGARGLRQAAQALDASHAITFLSGPEGGLSGAEEDRALACGFSPVTLGPRVLRAETAALCALAALLV
ncbi:MAG: 16S rRNA (uracil(1498)-N(3))-methyltransferase [Comamonadaceae bacterium]